ncbi:MAG: 3-dehydroquinate synthase [Parcubacteria group bacterium]|nr:3-dehydroquinate synthase [Parcubacteria group bacterium]
MTKINLQFEDNRTSEIIILDKKPADLLRDELKKKQYQQVVLFCDNQVAKLYGRAIEQKISSVTKTDLVTFPAGEKAKSFPVFAQLLAKIARRQYPRDTLVIALGGGVTGDLAGFIASIYMRGVDLWQVPTTLLAMVDSSIGGKNGINSQYAKNIIGTFYQPQKVLVTPQFLQSLPESQLQEGMAELIKTLILFDRTAFTKLENNPINFKRPNLKKLTTLIKICAAAKGKVVSADEREITSLRSVLNFGHTVGHAIEKVSKHKITHGQAVAMGMLVESQMSYLLGKIKKSEVLRIRKILQQYGFQNSIDFPFKMLYNVIKLDKKNQGGEICLPLVATIGKVARNKGDWVFSFKESVFKQLLKDSIELTNRVN